jgi:hypothetical protein
MAFTSTTAAYLDHSLAQFQSKLLSASARHPRQLRSQQLWVVES